MHVLHSQSSTLAAKLSLVFVQLCTNTWNGLLYIKVWLLGAKFWICSSLHCNNNLMTKNAWNGRFLGIKVAYSKSTQKSTAKLHKRSNIYEILIMSVTQAVEQTRKTKISAENQVGHEKCTDQRSRLRFLAQQAIFRQRVSSLRCHGVNGSFLSLMLNRFIQHEERLVDVRFEVRVHAQRQPVWQQLLHHWFRSERINEMHVYWKQMYEKSNLANLHKDASY